MVVFDLVVGILSIMLAVLAIGLSVKLYLMAEADVKRIQEAERVIQNSVQQLDRLFNLFYTDTWSLVRDSYTNMHDRLWDTTKERVTRRETREGATTGTEDPARPNTGELAERTLPVRDTGSSGVQAFLLDAYRRVDQQNKYVRAVDLVRLAERAGFATTDALDALFELTFVRNQLFLSGNQFSPQAVLADTKERAAKMQESLQDELLRDVGAGQSKIPGTQEKK